MIDEPRSPLRSIGRQIGKFVYFLSRRVSPGAARWLAAKDAVKRHDYRGIPLENLESAWRADPSWRDITAARGEIRSDKLGLAFTAHDLAAADYPTLLLLRDAGFAIARDGAALIAQNEHWRLRFTTAEHLSMAREIFVECCYGLRLTEPHVVVDIGANIGFASLYFAAQSWVHRVCAFEPFPATYEQLRGTLAANPALAAKIETEPYGLGDKPEQLRVSYDPQWSGSMSVAGLGAWRGSATTGDRPAEIVVRSAAEVIRGIRDRFPDHPLVAKIDCEGSEYPILRNLETESLLATFNVIVMEWHERRPDELAERLLRAGFGIHERPLVPTGTLGVIIAWRKPAR